MSQSKEQYAPSMRDSEKENTIKHRGSIYILTINPDYLLP